MKRQGNLFPKLISDENILAAIKEVNKTHRTHHGKINKTVLWIEQTKAARVEDLRKLIIDGFKPSPMKKLHRFDHSAGKWRDIN